MENCTYDYDCETVVQALEKHGIDKSWFAEIFSWEDDCRVIILPVAWILKTENLMQLHLRQVEKPEEELPSCVVENSRKTILFKIDYMQSAIEAL